MENVIRRLAKSVKIDIEGQTWVFATMSNLENVYKAGEAKLKEMKDEEMANVKVFVVIAIVIVAVALVLSIIYTKISITRPLNELIERAKNLSSGDGDLTRKLEVRGKDETALASMAINDFIEKVRVLIGDAKHFSSENSSVANELSSTSLHTGRRVEDATSIVAQTSQNCAAIQANMRASIEVAQGGKDDLSKALSYVDEANRATQNLASQITQTAQIESEMASKIDQLSRDAEQVKSVLVVINDIADKTNLLALNAAIEAARAGEHGRGLPSWLTRCAS